MLIVFELDWCENSNNRNGVGNREYFKEAPAVDGTLKRKELEMEVERQVAQCIEKRSRMLKCCPSSMYIKKQNKPSTTVKGSSECRRYATLGFGTNWFWAKPPSCGALLVGMQGVR